MNINVYGKANEDKTSYFSVLHTVSFLSLWAEDKYSLNESKNGDQLKGVQSKFHIFKCVLLHDDRSQTDSQGEPRSSVCS